jgi:SAM-dependent methyltransferase
MQADDLLRFTADVCERLHLTYFVTGSTATIAYGDPRLTADIDVVIELPIDSVKEFCEAFPSADFYVSVPSVQAAVRNRGQFNVIHPESGLKIDFMIPKETDFNRSRITRRRPLRVLPERDVSFASPEDAILMKLIYYQEGQSQKHLRDIAGVLRVQGDSIDQLYIAEWAQRLGVLDVWELIRQQESEQDASNQASHAPNVDRDWEDHYASGHMPWDSGLPSSELQRVLREHEVALGRALELGCGTGSNAVWLAQQGFDVTALDIAANALKVAREKAAAADVDVQWIHADVQNFNPGGEPFDFIFDRGCYHCCRRVDLLGYLQTLSNVTRPGTRFLCLCGNANEQSESRIPRVTEAEIRAELGGLFEFLHLKAMHFEDAGGMQGPLGWSVWMVRKPT